jgi:arabinofuranosyltransferase
MLKKSQSIIKILLILVGLYFVWQNKWISDDGYIYFRYIDNLLLYGNGLVFNPGEYVEGFTSPLWISILIGLKSIFHSISLRHLVFILGMFLAFLSFGIIAKVDQKMYSEKTSSFSFFLPLTLIISTQVIPEFFTSGLETPLVLLYSVLFTKEIFFPNKSTLYKGLLIGLGPLVRPELILLSIILFLVNIMNGQRDWLKTGIIASIPNLLYLCFRIYYYASLLPNTYYAKAHSGLYWEQGILYLQDLTQTYHTDILLLILVGILGYQIFKNTEQEFLNKRLILLSSITAYSIMVIAIGGDFMHGRFWLPVLIMISMNFSGLKEILLGPFTKKVSRTVLSIISLSILAAVFLINGHFSPVQYGFEFKNQIANERSWYQEVNQGKLSDWSVEHQNSLAETAHVLMKLSEQLGAPIKYTFTMVGEISYVGGDKIEVIDFLGLNDPVVARIQLQERGRPGHEKLAPAPYILSQGPSLWRTPYEEYNKRMTLIPGYDPVTDLSPSFLQAFDIEEAAKKAISEILELKKPDPNLIYMIKKLSEKNSSFELVQRIGALNTSSSWEKWTVQQAQTLKNLEEQIYNEHHFFENISIAIRNHRLTIDPL